MPKKFNSNSKFKKAFTLIELLVVVAIVSVIVSVVLFNYAQFNDNVALSAAGQEIAIAVREAQTYGLSVKETAAGTGQFTSAYGLFLDQDDPTNYVVFADTNANGLYDAGLGCGSGSTECIEKFTLRNGVKIKYICDENLCPPKNGIKRVDIDFLRPNPDALIYFTDSTGGLKLGPSAIARISLVSAKNTQSIILVENTGQVTVQSGSNLTKTIAVSKTGSGTGTVNGSGINCGAICQSSSSVTGSTATLLANPSSGFSFTGWSGDCSGTGSCVLVMDSNHSVTASFGAAPLSVDYLIVGGGGGGGSVYSSGGGGAGGLKTGSGSVNSTQSITVTVGAGGAGVSVSGNCGSCNQSHNGSPTSLSGAITASVLGGGGSGGYYGGSGQVGGSGGGGSGNGAPGAGTAGQGNGGGTSANGAGGGGGGAGGAGGNGSTNGGVGGIGLLIDGISLGGGGGGGAQAGSQGTASFGGGAAGANGISGTNGTGGGGGAAGAYNGLAGNGGSGIVIISYPDPQRATGGVVTHSGGVTYHTFTTVGVSTFTAN